MKVLERDNTSMKNRLFMKLDLLYDNVHINLSSSYNFFFLLKFIKKIQLSILY